MESIGELLRDARHRKQVSLEDVARTTKVKMDILEKLEADEFDRLASPTYAKSFLKLYADYLGLDSHALVDAYLKSQGGLRRQGLQVETAAAVKAKRSELLLPVQRVIAMVAGLTLLVVIIFASYALWTRWHQRHVEPSRPVATLPKLEYEAYYKPKNVPTPASLDLPGK
jgi:cytoskeletal protein RodZ